MKCNPEPPAPARTRGTELARSNLSLSRGGALQSSSLLPLSLSLSRFFRQGEKERARALRKRAVVRLVDERGHARELGEKVAEGRRLERRDRLSRTTSDPKATSSLARRKHRRGLPRNKRGRLSSRNSRTWRKKRACVLDKTKISFNSPGEALGGEQKAASRFRHGATRRESVGTHRSLVGDRQFAVLEKFVPEAHAVLAVTRDTK